ncbi:hypothetical protein [Peribacillus alkalitolerans]|nr:hypothetical protein [Peribacillus alkalitolerans]
MLILIVLIVLIVAIYGFMNAYPPLGGRRSKEDIISYSQSINFSKGSS